MELVKYPLLLRLTHGCPYGVSEPQLSRKDLGVSKHWRPQHGPKHSMILGIRTTQKSRPCFLGTTISSSLIENACVFTSFCSFTSGSKVTRKSLQIFTKSYAFSSTFFKLASVIAAVIMSIVVAILSLLEPL